MGGRNATRPQGVASTSTQVRTTGCGVKSPSRPPRHATRVQAYFGPAFPVPAFVWNADAGCRAGWFRSRLARVRNVTNAAFWREHFQAERGKSHGSGPGDDLADDVSGNVAESVRVVRSRRQDPVRTRDPRQPGARPGLGCPGCEPREQKLRSRTTVCVFAVPVALSRVPWDSARAIT
jgi:hypothetical protein